MMQVTDLITRTGYTTSHIAYQKQTTYAMQNAGAQSSTTLEQVRISLRVENR